MDGRFIAILIPIFGIILTGFTVYLYLMTRNKERMLQIEKGVDSSLFNNKKTFNVKNLVILGVFLIFAGIGFFVSSFLIDAGMSEMISYNGSLLIFGGIGLLVGYYMRNKLSK